MKVVIVGGVAGGATAAARIRRLDEQAEITVFERSGYISYANCGLPYYIGDVITDPEELTLQTPESFFQRFRINMKIHHEVISIHPDRKMVSVKNLEKGEIFEENYDKLILSPMSHAGYYPGGKVMTMKVVFEKETYRLLGAQIIGYEGVDKRIDVLATAIHAGLKATQLKDLDLAYAPPYSSAKDPVNMAGFMIDNIAKGTLKQWHLEDMDKISKDKSVVLLDVRPVGEFNRGHMDGFRNIPVDELRERINEIEKGKPVYLICQSDLRSYIASRILEGNGYETYNFSGGFRFYDAVVNDRALIERAYACGMDY